MQPVHHPRKNWTAISEKRSVSTVGHDVETGALQPRCSSGVPDTSLENNLAVSTEIKKKKKILCLLTPQILLLGTDPKKTIYNHKEAASQSIISIKSIKLWEGGASKMPNNRGVAK